MAGSSPKASDEVPNNSFEEAKRKVLKYRRTSVRLRVSKSLKNVWKNFKEAIRISGIKIR